MKSNIGKIGIAFCLIAIACFALAVLAGCDGFMLPSAPPTATEALAPTASPSPQPSPTPTESASPVVTPSPSPADTLSPSPSDEPSTSPVETLEASPTPSPESSDPGEQPTDAPTDGPTAEPTQEPMPVVTPKPTPETDHSGDSPDITVVKYYGRTSPGWLPAGLDMKLKYSKYWNNVAPENFLDYFVFAKSGTVRALPDSKSKAMETERATGRLALLAQVKGSDGKTVWYRVRTTKGAVGYVLSSAGHPDSFMVDKAFAQVKKLQSAASQPGTTHISNYNNIHGLPPKLPNGKSEDTFGNLRDQAAPAYLMPDKTSSFRYAPDGQIGQTLAVKGDFTEIYFPAWDEVRYVPTKYLIKGDFIKKLTQAIVVNRNPNVQNIIVFECVDNKWSIISMCYVSSGANHGAHDPTPVGDYFTLKHHGKLGLGEFFYFPDGTPGQDANGKPKFDGYAPWAIRFTGGAYLHGMPMGIHYDPVTNLMIKTKRTSEVYGNFIGVYPASHMCVRNYTSHAKFMYDWIKDGSAAVIVIE